MRALIVVDMQYDFIDGTLPVKGAWEIVPLIQEHIVSYTGPVLFTACSHPPNHCSFKEQGGQWPAHCIKGTRGAALQIGLYAMMQYWHYPLFLKGEKEDEEEHSGFANPGLDIYLRAEKVTGTDICGLAGDVCVAATAEHAARFGYAVNVLEHLIRNVK